MNYQSKSYNIEPQVKLEPQISLAQQIAELARLRHQKAQNFANYHKDKFNQLEQAEDSFLSNSNSSQENQPYEAPSQVTMHNIVTHGINQPDRDDPGVTMDVLRQEYGSLGASQDSQIFGNNIQPDNSSYLLNSNDQHSKIVAHGNAQDPDTATYNRSTEPTNRTLRTSHENDNAKSKALAYFSTDDITEAIDIGNRLAVAIDSQHSLKVLDLAANMDISPEDIIVLAINMVSKNKPVVSKINQQSPA